ncbi:MAG: hypothetical protein KAW92_08815 [Candidatus Cloacimonetes bacterium]|nr:hypothetical protein [Candidatus Cloacimonadota bacterium]
MSIAVKISEELARSAKINSSIFKRSFAGQIEFWATIGKIAEENEDLPFSFIKDILIGKEQAKNQDLTPYEFNNK